MCLCDSLISKLKSSVFHPKRIKYVILDVFLICSIRIEHLLYQDPPQERVGKIATTINVKSIFTVILIYPLQFIFQNIWEINGFRGLGGKSLLSTHHISTGKLTKGLEDKQWQIKRILHDACNMCTNECLCTVCLPPVKHTVSKNGIDSGQNGAIAHRMVQ